MIAKVNDIEMKYAKFGEGAKNFILIPGVGINDITDNVNSLKNAYARFTEEYTVYVFDRKENVPEGYTLKDTSDDTVAIIKSLGIEKADFLGVSQGGMVLQYIAVYYPEIVNKIVLGSTMATPNKEAIARLSRWVTLAREKNGAALAEDIVTTLYSEKLLNKAGKAIIRMLSKADEKKLEKFARVASATFSIDIYKDLDKIKCPALVIGVEGDKAVTGEASREIAEKLGCEIYMYGTEYAHAVFDEAPDYKDRVFEFFAR